jgi:hypothetical protein
MRYYHRTTADAAEAIVTGGFRDSSGSYMIVGMTLTGVFISDEPLDVSEGATGPALLAVDLPDDLPLDDHEVVEDDKPYREWCVPADLLNEHGAVRLLSPEEEDAIPLSTRFDHFA